MTDLELYTKARAKLCEVQKGLFDAYHGDPDYSDKHFRKNIYALWEDLAMWLRFDEDCGVID